MQDDGTRDAILTQYRLTKGQYFTESAAAKLKTTLEEDKLAGLLPGGVSPLSFSAHSAQCPVGSNFHSSYKATTFTFLE